MSQKAIRGRTADAIAASVEQALQHGSLAPGAPLPPIRRLAASLRVSPVTVAAAYRRLQARGLVVAGGRRGTRVREAPTAFVPAAARLAVADEDLRDLASGNPDPSLLPPMHQALRSMPPACRGYGEAAVLPELAAFAAGELAADGIPADALMVTSGGLDAIERLLREHLRPGDQVVVEDPSLPAVIDLVGASGFVARPVAMDAEGVLPDALERALTGARAVVLTPRAQNPTGAAWTRARASELAQVIRGRDELLVVENDPFGPVAGAPLVTLCSGAHPRWAAVRSVSKFLGPDLRLAIVAGDRRTIARVQGRLALGARWVSHLLQHAAVALWSDPASGRRLARASDVYAQRRRAVVEALAARGVAAFGSSGFNLWIPVREETSAVHALAARGWAVAAGERFRIRSAPGIRVTTAGLDARDAARFADDCAEGIRPVASDSA